MRGNVIKKRIQKGESVIGTFVKLSDPAAVEVLALVGFDFFVLDNEHVAMDREQLTNILRAAEAFDITALVRVRENHPVEILQSLDLGYAGVQVPNVDTAEQAESLVSSVKYGPIGARGFSPSVRACRYGSSNIDAYLRQSNDNTMIVSHCETTVCVSNLDAILAVDGIDVIFIGPMDLSQSLGVTGQTGSALVRETVDSVIERVRQSDKAVGTVAANAATAKSLIEQGVQYILLSSDVGMLLSWGKSALAELRG